MKSSAVTVRVHSEGGPLLPEEVAVTSPDPGWVRVRVTASGVCGADVGTARAHGATPPVTPGHEIAGVIAEIGDDVEGWSLGEVVEVGWFGGSCGHCDLCRRGDVVHCAERMVPGLSYPGGWAESVTVPAGALARVPAGLDPFDAAPLGCAGVTTFNAIRHARLPVGARVAVFGVGGLGHLAVQFAAKMGFDVVAIARGPERETLARGLGADHYIDSAATAPGAALRDAGGADLIVTTAPTTAPVSELLGGLRIGGRLTMIGIDGGSVEVPAAQLITRSQVLTGHLTGSPVDIEEAMRFALINGIRPTVERMPLERAGEAVLRLADGTPRFRIVLDASDAR